MSAHSGIEWTDRTWNPVTGCDRVSPGCAHCYALELAGRLKRMGQARYQRDGDPKTSGPGFGLTMHPDRLEEPLRWRKPRMVFVNSMSDLFHEEIPDEYILAVWAVMEAAPQHTFQILTKRPGRMRELLGQTRSSAKPQPPFDIRPVPGYPGYYADTDGAIFSDRRGRMKKLKPDAGAQGHLRVHLFGDGSRRGQRELVHRLILLTFDRPPRLGEQGRHLDGDPSNNRISNLAWGSQSENWEDSKRHGTDRRHCKLSAEQVARLRIAALGGESAYSLATRFGVSDTQARNIIRGDQWGFKVLPSVWLGVSIENRRFVHRADLLGEIPAAVRFVSAEPLLGPLIPEEIKTVCEDDNPPWTTYRWEDDYTGPSLRFYNSDGDLAFHWLIAGGESGPGHRPIDPEWVRDLRDVCVHEGVAFFFKQWGGLKPTSGGRLLDGREWSEFPRALEAAPA